ncbi:structural polyprotein [Chaetoceros socialis f. radians RNA virus 01]|uniref:Structural polyprotein n=4 Tax=Chaetoceros socialis f. radians RNA virus 01 TaxID=2169725 RepID=B9A8E1_9VIRU|nr:structural polyprotein [Chaetoceros socialis forma radians RNA virus 1]BAH22518.1 structural polyprotein [Chaetoceros socialis forma radians RNA virus 1]
MRDVAAIMIALKRQTQTPDESEFSSESGSGALPAVKDTIEGNSETLSGTHQNETLALYSNVDQTAVKIMSSIDPTRADCVSNDHELGNFLSRPVRIMRESISLDERTSTTIAPWDVYLRHPMINKKIANYEYLRANLVLEVVVNGGPFFYGKMLLGYTPFGYEDSLKNFNRIPIGHQNTMLSQQPHVKIDFCESTGGVLHLPFVYNRNYMRISEGSGEPASMGELRLNTLNALKNISFTGPASSVATITVFAYLDNVELVAPSANDPITAQQPELSSESEVDEYSGVISAPASSIARAAGKLKTIPQIAPFALATELGAGAIAEIAKIFGRCRPVVIDPPHKYRPTYVGNMANADIAEAVDKLSLTSKQELTINHDVIGKKSDGDDMHLSTFFGREAYMDRFEWKTTDSYDTLLFYTHVHPILFKRFEATSGDYDVGMLLPPVGYATIPFSFWRGGMTFRFSIVASAFHRGRLRIVYQPQGGLGTVPGFSAAFNRVIDLGDARDFEVTVEWNQNIAFREVHTTGSNVPSAQYTPGLDVGRTSQLPLGDQTSVSNGVLAVYVVNDLVSPDGGTDESVEVNWFVKGAPSFEVASRDTKFARWSTHWSQEEFSSESKVEEFSSESMASPLAIAGNRAGGSGAITLEPFGSDNTSPELSKLHFGETYDHMRVLVKGYNFYKAVLDNTTITDPDNPSGTVVIRSTVPDFPAPRGHIPNGPDKPFLPHPENAALCTHLTWFSPCYVARRGGIRWKYLHFGARFGATDAPKGLGFVNRVPQVPYGRRPLGNERLPLTDVNGFNPTELSQAFSNENGGVYATDLDVQPAIEVELPFYSSLRFVNPRWDDYEKIGIHRHSIDLLSYRTNGAKCEDAWMAYVAAGDDFNLSWMLSCPPFRLVNLDF